MRYCLEIWERRCTQALTDYSLQGEEISFPKFAESGPTSFRFSVEYTKYFHSPVDMLHLLRIWILMRMSWEEPFQSLEDFRGFVSRLGLLFGCFLRGGPGGLSK